MAHPKTLIFLHIPKTAGSTTRGILEMNYRKNERFLVREMWKDNPNFKKLSDAERARIKLLYGHMGFGLHEYLNHSHVEYFSLMRPVVPRIISLYEHILRFPDHHFAAEMDEHRYTLEELFTKANFLPFDNCQVRMLSGNMHAPFGTIGANDLQKAISNIEQHFPIVGIQERFDEFILLLQQRYNWKIPYYRRLKVNRSAKRYQPDAATLDVINTYNQLDHKLYLYVCERFKKQLSQHPEIAKKFPRYQKRNHYFSMLMNALPFVAKDDQ
ncbi:MAG: hypothetical protein LW750_05310 [Bacteroidetes bacterium]|nr:hypothetical protein [Bacteroidota bacterium]